MIRSFAVSALLAGVMATSFVVQTAQAGIRGYHRCGDGDLSKGYVVAQSRHGNGVVRGAVRPARHGYQVQTPRGNWIYCRRSCSETLRVETIDFWEGRQDLRAGLAQECGVFGSIDFGFGF